MVNTRILEERLGWGAGDGAGRGDRPQPDAKVVPLTDPHNPERRDIGHEPMLQGRIGKARISAKAQAETESRVAEAWQAMPQGATGVQALAASKGSLHAMDPQSVAAMALNDLRAQILRVMKEKGWQRIGITAPQQGSGATFVAAGLAASVARMAAMRVALVDMNLPDPALSARLDLPTPPHATDVLRGTLPPAAQMLRIGQNLAVLTQDGPLHDTADLSLESDFEPMLDNLHAGLAPDLVIVDLPPLREGGLARAMLPALDTVLLVVDGTRNTAADVSECEAMLEGLVPLMAAVLNKSEDQPARTGRGRRR